MTDDLRLERSTRGNVGILRVVGPVDSVSEPLFDAQLQQLAEKGARNVVIVLEKTTFMCSAGWGAMLTVLGRTRRTGGEVVLAAMAPSIKSVYTMLGMKQVLKEFPSEDAAVSSFP